MGISENIKRRRLELNLSQQELANAIGYTSRSTIAKIEAGENRIPKSKIAKFARALETTVDYLMTGVSGETADSPSGQAEGGGISYGPSGKMAVKPDREGQFF